MSRSLRVVLLVFLIFPARNSKAEILPASPLPPAGHGRTAYFVSDLHVGVGRDPANPSSWHPTEDFRWHDEFTAFLTEINSESEGNGQVDLILVGDVLELWQTAAGEKNCQHPNLGADWGCTEDEAKKRTRRVLEQHSVVFEQLRAFVSGDNENQVTILPGNHDVAFAFDGVRKLVLDEIGAPADRVRIASEGYWMSTDGRIFAEHGQQIGKDPNKFDGWPTKPFRTAPDGTNYLTQPWGEGFVQKIFNDVEIDYPVIDNLSSESLGVKYAAKDLGWTGTLGRIGDFARFVLFQQSWAQLGQLLDRGSDVPPNWRLDKIDVSTSKARWLFVAGSLEPGDPIGAQISAAADKMPEAPPFSHLELRAACDARWLRWKATRGVGVELCPYDGQLGAIGEAVREAINSGAKAERFRERLMEVRNGLPDGMRPTKKFDFYVYGHTHKEHDSCSPFAPTDDWKPNVINDGAWQRTASEEVFCALVNGKDPKDALRSLQPEDLPPCYPFVAALPSGEVVLRYWVQPTGKPGFILPACTELPTIPESCKEKRTTDACPAYPQPRN